MIELFAPPIHDTLASVNTLPDPAVLRNYTVRDRATVTSLLGDANQIWLGKPEVFNLVALFQKAGTELDPHLAMIAESADLYVVQFACSFRPAPQCQFVQASVNIHMVADNSDANPPVAYDLFPRAVELPVSYKRLISVSPNLKMSFCKVSQLEVSAFRAEASDEYLRYEPEITAFGVGESSPGWDLNKSKSRPIRGVKDFFVLLKKPKTTAVECVFDLSAWVQTYVGKIPLSSFFLSGSDKPLASERFTLKGTNG
jgi:hypothetical protein